MSRASEFQDKYGVMGAGALSKSLIGQLPRKSRQIGPVAGVSYRVASRMANSLRAGHPARCVGELESTPVILFHAPADQVRALLELLARAPIQWSEKSLLFCDCVVPAPLSEVFRDRGASVASARQFGIAGTVMVEGAPAALACAHRLAAELRLRAVEIAPGESHRFAAALTLANAALTPLINRAAVLLRECGLRDKEAVRIATQLFGQTVQEFGHSGKLSWAWSVREPDAEEVKSELMAVSAPFRGLFRQLVLAGFDEFEKHPAVAQALRDGDGI